MVTLNEGYIGGAGWFLAKFHAGLLKPTVALLVVTASARADQVLPGVVPAEPFGDDMVNRHRSLVGAAILAGMVVPDQHILAGQDDSLVRDFAIMPEPDHRGQGETLADSVNPETVGGRDHLGLALKHEHEGPLGAAYSEGHKILIEHQDASVNYGTIHGKLSTKHSTADE